MDEKRLVDGTTALAEKQARVIKIEPTERPQNVRLRVAAYTRVSSDSEDQLNSFAAQNRYYTELISGKAEWRIDRYLCIHLYELMDSLPLYYSEYFADKEEERRKLFEKLKYDIETIIKDFLNSIGSDKLYMDTPPELEGLSNRK